MSQFKWSYLSPQGKQYVVGLFHGPRTGHLMIYVNSKVVQVDFKVYNDAVYSFFIDEDLCEVTLEKKENTFHYDFKINKEADTPLNRKRKQFDKVNRRRIIGLFLGMAVFISAGILFGNYQKKKRAREETAELELWLKNNTRESVATINLVEETGSSTSVSFSYPAGDQLKDGMNVFDENTLIKNTQGIPLQKGDEFRVKYILSRDSVRLELDQPTDLQMVNYIHRAIEVETKFHPELPYNEIKCRVECAYRVKGFDGLADIYFQGIAPEENALHNDLSYKRLIRDIPFQKAFEQYCGF
jgi:hypothetical protein